jgi:hypothetical protein
MPLIEGRAFLQKPAFTALNEAQKVSHNCHLAAFCGFRCIKLSVVCNEGAKGFVSDVLKTMLLAAQ